MGHGSWESYISCVTICREMLGDCQLLSQCDPGRVPEAPWSSVPRQLSKDATEPGQLTPRGSTH